MIELKDICYARLGTRDLELATDFAIRILGLQPAGSAPGQRFFRSDARSHTLCYFDGDPDDHIVGFELADACSLDAAGAELEALGYRVDRGARSECESRCVQDFIRFHDPNGTVIEAVIRPEHAGTRYFASRDAGITGFNHVGLFTQAPVEDEKFWTRVCNARVSDRVGDLPLLRISSMHHSLALVPSQRSGIQHINHQVESTDDIFRSLYFLERHRVPIVFGPGRHPTSSARFLYFEGPDGMLFEYSVGVTHVDEEAHRERQFGFEPASLCMWGSRATNGELKVSNPELSECHQSSFPRERFCMTKVTITASDGSEFNAYMARPERTPAPAIIVIQEIFGVNAKIRAICDDFARQGYIALAPDLFWRQEPGVELNDASQEDFGKAMAYMSGFDFMLGIDDLKAALLQARRLEGASGKVGVVGYCLGGSLAYMMACFSDADASVGYYPVQIDPHLGHAEHIAKPLMLHIGEQDALCPPESQDAIWAGLSPNPLVSLHSYAGADHAFARVGGENYDSSAAQLANGRTAELFARVLR